MESRLLQASGVAAGFPVSSSTTGTARRHGQQQGFRVAAQRFMRGVDLGASDPARRASRVSRSGSVVVVAARRPAVQGQESPFCWFRGNVLFEVCLCVRVFKGFASGGSCIMQTWNFQIFKFLK